MTINRRKLGFGAAAVLLAALVIFVAVNAGKVLVVDAPQPSDVIVVLAGETDRRPARALELLSQGFGRQILLDVPADAKIYDFTQLALAEKYIQSLPHPESMRTCPIDGLSTRDEAHDVQRCLRQEETRILVVTSDFHTARALSIFRHELRGKSVSVAAAYSETHFGPHWWRHREWAKTCLDEWLRLLWWNAVDRWR